MPLTTAYLALGSNLGERLQQMRSALKLLEADGVAIVAESPVYQNRAIGMGDADPFSERSGRGADGVGARGFAGCLPCSGK